MIASLYDRLDELQRQLQRVENDEADRISAADDPLLAEFFRVAAQAAAATLTGDKAREEVAASRSWPWWRGELRLETNRASLRSLTEIGASWRLLSTTPPLSRPVCRARVRETRSPQDGLEARPEEQRHWPTVIALRLRAKPRSAHQPRSSCREANNSRHLARR